MGAVGGGGGGEGEGNLDGVYGLVWGIGLRRLGCGCGRRLVTGSCVFRETTQTGCPWSWPRVSLSIYLLAQSPHRCPHRGASQAQRRRAVRLRLGLAPSWVTTS